jgi:hypothetical protein
MAAASAEKIMFAPMVCASCGDSAIVMDRSDGNRGLRAAVMAVVSSSSSTPATAPAPRSSAWCLGSREDVVVGCSWRERCAGENALTHSVSVIEGRVVLRAPPTRLETDYARQAKESVDVTGRPGLFHVAASVND